MRIELWHWQEGLRTYAVSGALGITYLLCVIGPGLHILRRK